ncbi:hypothetical protein [Falsiphaeobacter marinintestinus]|uniref:hypothetical protein n=1 Tax=Falsiphaeobacter marinintestinus TaxID=1492905 RepID=UPI0011B49B57|nr:hypothetical protein [Phaeobacter marinintestinus]
MENYSPAEHRFRFAAWAASRAASRGLSGFSTAIAQKALKAAKLCAICNGPSNLPENANDFDAAHRVWCKSVIEASGPNSVLSYGRAAKLVNVYLKVLFLSDFGLKSQAPTVDRARVDAIHPPIDRVLLTELARQEPTHKDFWKAMRNKGWTNFDQDEYQDVIAKVREITNGQLWRIEAYWKGSQ